MSSLWNGLLDLLGSVLHFFHDATEPLVGDYSWAVGIVLLTLAIRLLLVPLAVKQLTSMRAMQAIQPEIKRVQKKYKADRSLMKTDPQKYQAQRRKQQEALMGLYKEHGVNPAAGCLPLIAQAPIFFALFSLLRGDRIPELAGAPSLLINDLTATIADGISVVGIGAVLLMVLMGVTTYVSSQQMSASNPTAEQAPQQKIMTRVMPVMLMFFSYSIPAGVLIYWVTTNLWTMGQQWFLFRTASTPAPA